MCADGTKPTEPTQETQSDTPEQSGGGWARRKFLTAAALGTAAAAFLSKADLGGVRVGPLAAYADDLSSFQCTANDVRIIGTGQIVNESCPCNGTFDAQVTFTVQNNAASDRTCITLHLCAQTINGVPFPQTDVLLQGTLPGKQTIPMTGTIPNYPCGSGLVCFGATPASGVLGDVFAKGENCPTGACCGTISWRIPGQDPDCSVAEAVIKSKCRHQQICIQGRGHATIACNPCTVPCGGSTTITVGTTSASSFGPFTFGLTADDPAVVITPGAVSADGKSQAFTADKITKTTVFTGTVTDNGGAACASTAQTTVTTTPVPAPTFSGKLDAGCVGSATFTVAQDSNFNASFYYTYVEVDCATKLPISGGQSFTGQGLTSATFTFPPTSTDDTHCVRVTASNGFSTLCDQTADASVVVPALVTATLAISNSTRCSGVVTLLATAGGGVAPYSFQFSIAGTVTPVGNNQASIDVSPVLDGSCRSVTVTVTDSRGCSKQSAPAKWSSCVVTTTPC